jgi:hypothetical protein
VNQFGCLQGRAGATRDGCSGALSLLLDLTAPHFTADALDDLSMGDTVDPRSKSVGRTQQSSRSPGREPNFLERIHCPLRVTFESPQEEEETFFVAPDKREERIGISTLELPDEKPLAQPVDKFHVYPFQRDSRPTATLEVREAVDFIRSHYRSVACRTDEVQQKVESP